MTRYPVYLTSKHLPDEELLNKIRGMVKEGKGPKKIKNELQDTSLYIIMRYYTKIRRGIW